MFDEVDWRFNLFLIISFGFMCGCFVMHLYDTYNMKYEVSEAQTIANEQLLILEGRSGVNLNPVIVGSIVSDGIMIENDRSFDFAGAYLQEYYFGVILTNQPKTDKEDLLHQMRHELIHHYQSVCSTNNQTLRESFAEVYAGNYNHGMFSSEKFDDYRFFDRKINEANADQFIDCVFSLCEVRYNQTKEYDYIEDEEILECLNSSITR